jgi:hypothetical protein
MNKSMSNEFGNEEPTKDTLRVLPLAREIIGDLTIELFRLADDIVFLEASVGTNVVKSVRTKGLSDFQAGRLFEREVAAYQGILK